MNNNEKIIGIIGLGLIGGSLALNLAGQNKKIIGIVKNQSEIFIHESFQLITNDLNALRECDLIFICTPLHTIPSLMEQIQPYLKNNCIVSDVGSLKEEICQKAHQLSKENYLFIGGHPMAGTEKSGFGNAFPELFKDKAWVLIEKDKKEKTNFLTQTIESTGAKIIWTQSAKHDKAVSLISHLPLLLSMGLFNTLNEFPDSEIKELAQVLASSGFVGMTRLARGNAELNKDLLTLNKENIRLSYLEFMKQIEKLEV